MTRQLILVHGKPGCGKSTTSRLAAEQLGDAYHFSMGDELRARGLHGKPSKYSEELKQHAEAMRQSLPVPADLVANVFEECVETSPFDTILVDGYPQYPDRLARFNETLANVGARVLGVCLIDVSDEVADARMDGRSGRMKDVIEDDAYRAKRLAGFRANVVPIIEILGHDYPVHHIDGAGSPDAVAAELVKVVQVLQASNG